MRRQDHGFVHDLAGRMNGIASPAGTFTYSYNPGLAQLSGHQGLQLQLALLRHLTAMRRMKEEGCSESFVFLARPHSGLLPQEKE
jgi:hypothetical protein